MNHVTRATCITGVALIGALAVGPTANASTTAAPEAPSVTDVAFNDAGTRAYVDVKAKAGNVVLVKDEDDAIVGVKRVGPKGHVQVPLTVETDAELPVSVQQSDGGATSAENDFLIAPAPVIDTIWAGEKGAVLRIDKQYGTVRIYDAAGKFIAQRSGQENVDTLVTVPLTSPDTHFTAVRSSSQATSTPTAFSVKTGSDRLGEPTIQALSGFAGIYQVKGQPGALFELEDKADSSNFSAGNLSSSGIALIENPLPAEYTLKQVVRGDESASVDVVIPTP